MGDWNYNSRVNSSTKSIVSNLMQLRNQSRNVLDKILFTNKENEWNLLGKYKIVHHGGNNWVYKYENFISEFPDKGTATAWCILDSNGKITDANSLSYYSNIKKKTINNILVLKNTISAKGNSEEDKEILYSKLTNEIQKLNSSKKQIDKLKSLAKYFQRRGFNYEAV